MIGCRATGSPRYTRASEVGLANAMRAWLRSLLRLMLRAGEHLLGPAPLASLVAPGAILVSAMRVASGRSDVRDPSEPLTARRLVLTTLDETRAAMSGLAWVFRDRFSLPRWRRRIQIPRGAILHEALASARPIILATVHTECMLLLARSLCAAGFDTGILVETASGQSPRFTSDSPRAQTSQTSSASTPRTLTRIEASKLRDAIEFLRAPRILVVALDGWRGKHATIISRRGVEFTLATGALRLARATGAVCIPAVLLQERLWRYRLTLGAPIPAHAPPEDALARLADDILDAVLPRRGGWTGVLRAVVRPATFRPEHATPEVKTPSEPVPCPNPA